MDNYDAIIIGAGIAGLGAGGLLQDRGLKTLVIERGATAGGRAQTFAIPGGWRIDTGTHCVDMGRYSTCANLLKALGIDIPWSRNLEGLLFYNDEGKWTSMREYLDLSKEEEKELAELQQWVKSATDELIDSYDTISLTSLIEEKVKSPKVAEFVKTVAMIHTTLTEADIISAGEFIHIYREQLSLPMDNDFPFNQVRMPLGGIGTMTKAMAEAYEKKGGTLLLNTPVRNVNVQKRAMTQVVTDSGAYTAPSIVVAMPIWDMLKILPMDKISKLAPEWAARMRQYEFETSAGLGFTLGTRAPLFTEPCYLSAWRIPGLGLPMQILGHSLFDDTIAPANHMISFIGACCTPTQAMDEDFCKQTMDAFWAAIIQMFPDLEANLLWKNQNSRVGIDGLSRSPGMTGRHRPRVFLPEVPGLYFAGDCYSGRGIGMNLAADSAMICVNEIMARQGK